MDMVIYDVCPCLFSSRIPHLAMEIFRDGMPVLDPKDSIFFTTSKPSNTTPNTTWRPSKWGVRTVVMKNCDPLVCRPAFAIDSKLRMSIAGVSCRWKKRVETTSDWPVSVDEIEINSTRRKNTHIIHTHPGPVCFKSKFSSRKRFPYIESPPYWLIHNNMYRNIKIEPQIKFKSMKISYLRRTSPIMVGKISSLDHEIWNDSVK